MKECLIIMPILFRGGSEKQMRYVIEAISEKDLPLTVLVESSDKSMNNEEVAYAEKYSNVNFVFLRTGAVDAKYTNSVKKYWAKFLSLIKILKTTRGLIKKNRIGIVMVTNLTGLVLLPWFKMHGCQVVYNERNPGIKVCDSRWKRALLKRCKKLVCNSKYASEYMMKILGREVEVINNGIQEISVVPTLLENDGIFRIIVPARISHVKNQKLILEAINILKETEKIKVIFAGVVEDEKYYEVLMEYCAKNKIEQFVDFVGFTNNILEYYAKCDLLVLASLEEGTPNVLLEAFMGRLKVIASDIPMNAECMHNKKMLFSPNDAAELAQKIIMMKNLNKAEQEEFLVKNYNYVCENYSIKCMGERYIQMLYLQ